MRIEDILKTSRSLSLNKRIIVNLLYTNNQLSNKLNDILKSYDISLQQFNVLRILRGQKNKPASLAMVQERMISKMSNTTRLIDKLIKKRFVEKDVNQENKRKIDIHITNEGLELLNYVDPIIDKTEKNIVSKLTQAEKEELIRLLGKIR